MSARSAWSSLRIWPLMVLLGAGCLEPPTPNTLSSFDAGDTDAIVEAGRDGAQTEDAASDGQRDADGADASTTDADLEADATLACSPGAFEACGSDIGACVAGRRFCLETGDWSTCEGAVTATAQGCDGEDTDCDGTIDEGCDCGIDDRRPCGDDVGECVAGIQNCVEGRWATCLGDAGPRAEACDGLDNDCDGQTDEAIESTPIRCGVGVCLADGERVCQPGGWVNECTPAEGRDELCNTLDDDCDGAADEGLRVGEACTVGVGACRRGGTRLCLANGQVGCSAEAGVPGDEICDGIDNDCDGATDELPPGAGCQVGRGGCLRDGRMVCVDGAMRCGASPGDPIGEACNGEDDDCDGRVDEGPLVRTDLEVYRAAGRSLTPDAAVAYGDGVIGVAISTTTDVLFKALSLSGALLGETGLSPTLWRSLAPDVIWNEDRAEFAVGWRDEDAGIRRARLSVAGAIIQAGEVVPGSENGNDAALCWTSVSECVFGPCPQFYTASWVSSDGLYTERQGGNHLLGQAPDMGEPRAIYGGNNVVMAVVAGGVGWFGAMRVSNLGYGPLDVGAADTPAIGLAWARASGVVWSNAGNVWFRRYDSRGAPLDGVVRVMGGQATELVLVRDGLTTFALLAKIGGRAWFARLSATGQIVGAAIELPLPAGQITSLDLAPEGDGRQAGGAFAVVASYDSRASESVWLLRGDFVCRPGR